MVALKVIRRGMDSREVIARFEGERQALPVSPRQACRRGEEHALGALRRLGEAGSRGEVSGEGGTDAV